MGKTRSYTSTAVVTIGIFMSSFAQAHSIIAVGNGLFKPQAIERLVRGSIASALDGTVTHNSLNFKVAGIKEQKVTLPPDTGDMKSIFEILGIKNTLQFGLNPIQLSFTLPDSNLKLDIQNRPNNSFVITANWSLSQLQASSSALNIRLPTGAFDQSALIKSSPVQISLKNKTPDVKISIVLIANLGEEGAKIKLQSVKTNLLSANHPEFAVKIGKLTVNGAPFELTVKTNGQTLVADEPTLRAHFQTLEQTYADTIRVNISEMILQQLSTQLRALETSPSLRYTFNTDEALVDQTVDKSTKSLLSGIDVSLILSYLQSLNGGKIYSAQLSSEVCMDGHCVDNTAPTTAMGMDDVRTMDQNGDASMILYESFFKNLVESKDFQSRIANYFQSEVKSPGVNLSSAGMKIFFEPNLGSFVAVLNLEIDIKKTVAANNPFGLKMKRRIGDWIENGFGSGKFVKVPVPILFKLNGLKRSDSGAMSLSISSDIPGLSADGKFSPYSRCSTTDCPNNIQSMTDLVRKDFIPSVKEEIMKSLPREISLPMDSSMKFNSLNFSPKSISFTPNLGIIFTVGVEP